MKSHCICGYLFADNSDAHPFKAYLVADEDWFGFTDSCLRPQGNDWRLSTKIYQCPTCGRIKIEKPTGKVYFFKPEGEMVSKNLFRSVALESDVKPES